MVENPSNILKSQEDARKVKEQVLEWMSSYNAPIAQRRWEKQLEDLEKLVTPKVSQIWHETQSPLLASAWGYQEKTSSPHKLNIALSETTYLQLSA